MQTEYASNPVLDTDFPDPDIIRVGETYYMASTTMYFMPGGDILRSYDLIHWELLCHVFDRLEDNDAHNLQNGRNIYGQGMWAPSLRWHEGMFYLVFSCNDTRRSLLFTARDAAGPWQRRSLQGFYYDPSLYFEDDRAFIVHGNATLRLTELDPQTWAPRAGGLQRVLAQDAPNQPLGYEGRHLYRHSGRYYLFTCHMTGKSRNIKTQVCLMSDSLTGEFVPRTILDDDIGPCRRGVAQGGMVQTPRGGWYLFMFHDRGALGRAPVLLPMTFDADGYPCAAGGKTPPLVPVAPGSPSRPAKPLNGNAFCGADGRLPLWWQFSHNPDFTHCRLQPDSYSVTTAAPAPNLLMARNTLTQRCVGPADAAEVTVDASALRAGDYAGLAVYEGCYGAVALNRTEHGCDLVMLARPAADETVFGRKDLDAAPVEYARIPAEGSRVRLRASAAFPGEREFAAFFWQDAGGSWRPLGIAQPLYFKMDLFTGCRFALFCYSTRQSGGTAVFTGYRQQAAERTP